MVQLTTLCYIRKKDQYLMLHRIVKQNDVNKDKWIGIGGHFEKEESPEECLLREVKEETGYTLTSYRYRAVVTFVSGDGVTEYMSLFTADGYTGDPVPCDEGVLEWVSVEQIWKMNIWPGDKIFFRLLDEDAPFFSLKLVYDGHGGLVSAALNGAQMELFDLLRDDGTKSGQRQERGVVHREGSLHGTVHMWIIRGNGHGGYDVLLQKRSAGKDSNPGCYDISSAGHIQAGDEPLPAALREMKEELGITALPEQLVCIGEHRGSFAAPFYGRMFRDRELSHVYLYREPVEISGLRLQESEVESVCWMDYETCRQKVAAHAMPNCIYLDEFDMVGNYLREKGEKDL